MSDIIQLLPDSVANQIAAGEVIQRPASVIKELVENAVDADASRIDVSVVDAGRTSIQVIDNGKGMSETDARLAFERHATSKIRQADDLFQLHTMGFRGEALPSIVAVAQVELKTRQENDETGTDLRIAASKVESQEPCACPVGANFMVENLFFNVPARRKFLKSNSTELSNIITAFERIALVYPKIAFTLHSNGSELYNLRTGSLRQRIVDIFGKRINQDLLPVNVETSVCSIGGFIGKPESAKKKGAKQYFFVNGRYMRHPYFHKAIQSAYERLVPQGDQVPYFVYFDVNPMDIDVNIHPTKTEIKFENEQAIFQILLAAVKDAVGAFSNVSTIDFDTEDKPEIPVFNGREGFGGSAGVQMPKVDYDPLYNPFRQSPETQLEQPSASTASSSSSSSMSSSFGGEYFEHDMRRPQAPVDWQELYKGLENNQPTQQKLFAGPVENGPANAIIEEKSPIHYQYKGRYIMTAVKSGLMIVDQRRAHIRVLFDQYLSKMGEHKMHSQKVIFPQTIELSAREAVALSQVKDDIALIGFELSATEENTYAINAIPEGFEGVDTIALLHDILADVLDAGDIGSPENALLAKVLDKLALRLARAMAITYGQVLDNNEMENVVNSLFQCSNVNYTPDGKVIVSILKQTDLEQMMG